MVFWHGGFGVHTYLANLPTIKKKLKVMSDWTADLIYRPDVAMIKKYMYERHEKEEEIGEEDRKDIHKQGGGSVHDKGEKNENDSSKKSTDSIIVM